jgi:hypothetical protein
MREKLHVQFGRRMEASESIESASSDPTSTVSVASINCDSRSNADARAVDDDQLIEK